MSFDDRLLMNLLLPVGLMLALYRLPVSVVAARWLVVGLLAGLTAYYATWQYVPLGRTALAEGRAAKVR